MAENKQIAIWLERKLDIAAKMLAGQVRLDEMNDVAALLIAQGGDDAVISRAKADCQAAEIDLAHFERALETIALEIDAANSDQEEDVLNQKANAVSRLQRKRAKLLKGAEVDYRAFLEKLIAAEDLAIEIHEAGSGCRPLGIAVNDRYGPMTTWLILQLLDAMPLAESHIGAVVANHQAARQQNAGKDLASLQPDYAAMFKQFHAEKDQAA
jgi:hypothetical protein